ncbi:hypothetical protein PMI01_02190 [Caulobacter sp. AP07]|nr:hypothetical protein PMI01_02190 [Caulobacter sp. AP07]
MRSNSEALPVIDAEYEEISPKRRERWRQPYHPLPRLIAFAPCLLAIWVTAMFALQADEPAMRVVAVIIAAFQWPIHRLSDWFWKSLHQRVSQEAADDLRERIIGRRHEL